MNAVAAMWGGKTLIDAAGERNEPMARSEGTRI